MAEPGGRGRTVLRIPRVEFDLGALVLGAAITVSYAAFWPVMAAVLGVAPGQTADSAAGPAREVDAGVVLRSGFLDGLHRWLPVPGAHHVLGLLGRSVLLVRPNAEDPKLLDTVSAGLPLWKYAVTGAALLVLWSILGGALARVYALRKARDESIPFDEGLAYSFRNLRQFIQAPLFAAAAAVLFVAVLLACGALSAIPGAGPVIQIAAQPLSLLAALVTVVICTGLVLGFPMMTAAIAVERGGSLDAVSRAMVYIWTRPVPFAITSMIVLAVAVAVETVGSLVLKTGGNFFLLGVNWVDPAMIRPLARAFQSAAALGTPVVDESLGVMGAASVWIAWAVVGLAVVAVRGFVVSYLVGGIVDVYFMLREEADQVPQESVFVETPQSSLGEPVPGEPKQG